MTEQNTCENDIIFVKTVIVNGVETTRYDTCYEIEDALKKKYENQGEMYDKVFGVKLECAKLAGWHPEDEEFDTHCEGYQKFMKDRGQIHSEVSAENVSVRKLVQKQMEEEY